MSSRAKEIAKIHIGKKSLGLSDDLYRSMLLQHGGAESAADLDAAGRRAVLQHMRDCGVKFSNPKKGQAPHNIDRLPAYVQKVEALLADMNLPWSYADAIARRISGGWVSPVDEPGVERLAWLKSPDHWRDLVGILSIEQEKRHRHRHILDQLDELGYTEEFLVEVLGSWGVSAENWSRNRRLMRRISAYLETHLPQPQEASK